MTDAIAPKGWCVKNIKDLIDRFDAGVSVNGGDRKAENGELGVLKVSSVTEGVFNPYENKVISSMDIERASVNPKKDRIIMSRANSPDLVGASAYIDKNYPLLFLSDKLWQFEPKKQVSFSMRWLSYVLSSSEYREKLSKMATGTSQSMKNIPQHSVMGLSVAVPPQEEQELLVGILALWDTAIEKTEKLIEAKEKYLKVIYQQAFSPMRLQDSRWKKIRIDNFVSPRTEKQIPSDAAPLYSLTIEDGITAKTERYNREFLVKDSTTKAYKTVHPGDIVFNPANLRWGAIARSEVKHDVVVSPIYEVLQVHADKVIPDLLLYALTCPRQIRLFSLRTEGTLVERMAVKLDVFLQTSIIIPTDRVQQEQIASAIRTIKHEVTLLKKQAEAYRTQKRGLMQKLLTGQWRVKAGGEVTG